MILINKLARITIVTVLLGKNLFAHAGFWDYLPGNQASELSTQESNFLVFGQHLSTPRIGVAFYNQLMLTLWHKVSCQTALFQSTDPRCWQDWRELEAQFMAQLQENELPPIEAQPKQISREVTTAQVIVQEMLSILQKLYGDVQKESRHAKALQEIVQLMTHAQQELKTLQALKPRSIPKKHQKCVKQWQNFVRSCLISAELGNPQQLRARQLITEIAAYLENESE